MIFIILFFLVLLGSGTYLVVSNENAELTSIDNNSNKDANSPVDCELSEWKTGECDKECGGGKRLKIRSIKQMPKGDGATCPPIDDPSRLVKEDCNEQQCPVDCEFTEGTWGECKDSKGNVLQCVDTDGDKDIGIQNRTNTIIKDSDHGGSTCPPTSETRTCDPTPPPCEIDCKVSEWENWGSCSKSCVASDGVNGTQTRNRSVSTPRQHGGATCPPLSETRACSPVPDPCSIDCVVNDKFDNATFSPCSHVCGGGTQTKTAIRTITQQNNETGATCPPIPTQTQSCNTHNCPSKLYKVQRAGRTCSQLTDESGVSNIYQPVSHEQCKSLWNHHIDGWLPPRASSYGNQDAISCYRNCAHCTRDRYSGGEWGHWHGGMHNGTRYDHVCYLKNDYQTKMNK